jgi:peptidoglycan DL-endopeptidase CwlO
VVGADRAAVDRGERLRREVEALAAKLADQAERQERCGPAGPYVWGASGPSSYDCSDLVMAAYRRAGVGCHG